MTKPENFWYASYGSNLNLSRFMIYIAGGNTPGSDRLQPGCRDKTPPSEIVSLTLPHRLYFAGWADGVYGGGTSAAFLSLGGSGEALGRAYLITNEQFEDVVKQENGFGRADTANLNVNVEEAVTNGHSRMLPSGFYDELIYCGERDGYPVLSFTHSSDLAVDRPPSAGYVQMIASGLHEAHGLNADQAATYLADKGGIVGRYSLEQLRSMVVT